MKDLHFEGEGLLNKQHKYEKSRFKDLCIRDKTDQSKESFYCKPVVLVVSCKFWPADEDAAT